MLSRVSFKKPGGAKGGGRWPSFRPAAGRQPPGPGGGSFLSVKPILVHSGAGCFTGKSPTGRGGGNVGKGGRFARFAKKILRGNPKHPQIGGGGGGCDTSAVFPKALGVTPSGGLGFDGGLFLGRKRAERAEKDHHDRGTPDGERGIRRQGAHAGGRARELRAGRVMVPNGFFVFSFASPMTRNTAPGVVGEPCRRAAGDRSPQGSPAAWGGAFGIEFLECFWGGGGRVLPTQPVR